MAGGSRVGENLDVFAHSLQLAKPLNGCGEGPGSGIQHPKGIEHVYLEPVRQRRHILQRDWSRLF